MSDLEVEQAPPEAPEGAEPEAPEAPAEPAWSGPSQEEWQETQEALQYMAQTFLPRQPEPEGPERIELDPLDDGFQTQLDQWAEQKFAPFMEYVQAQQFREGEARAMDILSDIKAREGDFVFDGSTEKARTLANSYIPQTNQQFPNDPARAAEQALELAAKDIREWEQQVGKAYHEQQLNQLGNLGGARQDLGVDANGAQQFTIPPGGGLLDVVARHTGTRR